VLLKDKVGIVSGLGPGLGTAVALAFAREGADVALLARREENLRDVAKDVERMGRRAFWSPTDVTDGAACQRFVDQAHRALGRIDILVNNAFYGGPQALLVEGNLDAWRQAMEVNYWGALNMVDAVLPFMRLAGEGRIVNVTTAAIRLRAPGRGAYIGSKSAVAGMTKALATELGEYGIRVNSIVPGWIWGPVIERMFAEQASERGVDPQVIYSENASQLALQYLPTADEIAGTVIFFASSLSRAVTGQALDVNAGQWYSP